MWFWIAKKEDCLHEQLQVPDARKILQGEIDSENQKIKINSIKFSAAAIYMWPWTVICIQFSLDYHFSAW